MGAISDKEGTAAGREADGLKCGLARMLNCWLSQAVV
jgi:hypothetical protein